jgi:hypothetical protein
MVKVSYQTVSVSVGVIFIDLWSTGTSFGDLKTPMMVSLQNSKRKPGDDIARQYGLFEPDFGPC